MLVCLEYSKNTSVIQMHLFHQRYSKIKEEIKNLPFACDMLLLHMMARLNRLLCDLNLVHKTQFHTIKVHCIETAVPFVS